MFKLSLAICLLLSTWPISVIAFVALQGNGTSQFEWDSHMTETEDLSLALNNMDDMMTNEINQIESQLQEIHPTNRLDYEYCGGSIIMEEGESIDMTYKNTKSEVNSSKRETCIWIIRSRSPHVTQNGIGLTLHKIDQNSQLSLQQFNLNVNDTIPKSIGAQDLAQQIISRDSFNVLVYHSERRGQGFQLNLKDLTHNQIQNVNGSIKLSDDDLGLKVIFLGHNVNDKGYNGNDIPKRHPSLPKRKSSFLAIFNSFRGHDLKLTVLGLVFWCPTFDLFQFESRLNKFILLKRISGDCDWSPLFRGTFDGDDDQPIILVLHTKPEKFQIGWEPFDFKYEYTVKSTFDPSKIVDLEEVQVGKDNPGILNLTSQVANIQQRMTLKLHQVDTKLKEIKEIVKNHSLAYMDTHKFEINCDNKIILEEAAVFEMTYKNPGSESANQNEGNEFQAICTWVIINKGQIKLTLTRFDPFYLHPKVTDKPLIKFGNGNLSLCTNWTDRDPNCTVLLKDDIGQEKSFNGTTILVFRSTRRGQGFTLKMRAGQPIKFSLSKTDTPEPELEQLTRVTFVGQKQNKTLDQIFTIELPVPNQLVAKVNSSSFALLKSFPGWRPQVTFHPDEIKNGWLSLFKFSKNEMKFLHLDTYRNNLPALASCSGLIETNDEPILFYLHMDAREVTTKSHLDIGDDDVSIKYSFTPTTTMTLKNLTRSPNCSTTSILQKNFRSGIVLQKLFNILNSTQIIKRTLSPVSKVIKFPVEENGTKIEVKGQDALVGSSSFSWQEKWIILLWTLIAIAVITIIIWSVYSKKWKQFNFNWFKKVYENALILVGLRKRQDIPQRLVDNYEL